MKWVVNVGQLAPFFFMESGKVTAIATSVIAICLLGFAFTEIYNDPKNVKERCTAKYAKKEVNDSIKPSYLDGFQWSKIIEDEYSECLGYKGDLWDLARYRVENGL